MTSDAPDFAGARSGLRLVSDRIVLASASATRARLLEAAGVPHLVAPAEIDEGAVRAALTDAAPEAVAAALAERKAAAVAARFPDDLVLGADQVLSHAGRILAKPRDRAEALAQLRLLRGGPHRLISAAALVQGGAVVWRAHDVAVLHMRATSDKFLDSYLDAVGADALTGPGAYRLEERGAQLFARIEGDFFTVLGLPLLALLEALRRRGILAT